MGDVQRIMYVHVPTAWNAMLALTFAFACAVASLWRGGIAWDARLEAAIEVGVVLSALLCMQGAIWAKPTWGVWWDWDPRLTTTAVMVFAFGGILALRQFVDDPVKRATWSAVATVIAFADVPIVYFSVRWWNSLHQLAVLARDGFARVPLAAAHQRVRHPLPDVRAHLPAHARWPRCAARRSWPRRCPRRRPGARPSRKEPADEHRSHPGWLGVRVGRVRGHRDYTHGLCACPSSRAHRALLRRRGREAGEGMTR